jgi:hypothetical protein
MVATIYSGFGGSGAFFFASAAIQKFGESSIHCMSRFHELSLLIHSSCQIPFLSSVCLALPFLLSILVALLLHDILVVVVRFALAHLRVW